MISFVEFFRITTPDSNIYGIIGPYIARKRMPEGRRPVLQAPRRRPRATHFSTFVLQYPRIAVPLVLDP
jgi:hypothetical protein